MAHKFRERSADKEKMDDLSISGATLHRTLYELDVINKYLGGNKVTLDALDFLLKTFPQNKKIEIVDVGCGSGAMLKLISRWAQEEGWKVCLKGIDANADVVDYARQLIESPGWEIEQMEVQSDQFQTISCDIIIATLFTHHFTNDQLSNLLSAWYQQVTTGIIINDLHRHPLAYYSINFITKLFSSSDMVKFDAPLSVLRAFSRSDIDRILKKAGIIQYRLSWKWAFRWQLIIPKSREV